MFSKLFGLFSKPAPSEPELNRVRSVHYDNQAGEENAVSNSGSSPIVLPQKQETPETRAAFAGIHASPKPLDHRVEKWVGWNVCGYTRVVGVTAYRRDAEHTARKSRLDKPLKLVREPDNPHDKNAIMVLDGRSLVGYIDRHVAKALNDKFSIEMPIRAIFKDGYVGETGAISIDILPQMPSAKERKAHGWQIS